MNKNNLRQVFKKRDEEKEDFVIKEDCTDDPLFREKILEIDILLIGKTGNGKSALGNSILGHKVFESCPNPNSITQVIMCEVAEVNGFQIKVVDTPGVSDTGRDVMQDRQYLFSAFSEALMLNPKGYHAVLLVMRFGNRFTLEERNAISFLKKVFGETFSKKFFILVFTHGDQFDEVNGTFKEWVKHPDLVTLLSECNNRVVLFDNKTCNIEKQNAQRSELIGIIKEMKLENCRYFNEHFQLAETARDSLLLEADFANIENGILDEMHFISQRLKYISDNVECRIRVPFLEDLHLKASNLYNKIEKLNKNTGVLNTLLKHIWSLINAVRDEIIFSEKICKKIDSFNQEMSNESLCRALGATAKDNEDKNKKKNWSLFGKKKKK